ncbi:MAG TPA: BrnA antitoxin family protein [Terriglobales bacterium]|nr:BrnA antitoxin family protein [Terriglobales bacterium]
MKKPSSKPGAPSRTKGAHTGRSSRSSGRTGSDWTRLRSMTSHQIRSGIESDADARPTDVNFWKTAKLVLPAPKRVVTMRLDDDLLRWFRRHRGYQTRINAILRAT